MTMHVHGSMRIIVAGCVCVCVCVCVCLCLCLCVLTSVGREGVRGITAVRVVTIYWSHRRVLAWQRIAGAAVSE